MTAGTFLHSGRLRAAVAVAFAAVLVISGAGVWRSVVTAGETTQAPSVDYSQSGEFDYKVVLAPTLLYGDFALDSWTAKPSGDEGAGEKAEPGTIVFFRDILSDMDMTFSYQVLGDIPLGGIDSTAVISIVASNEGLWEREVSRSVEEHTGQRCAVSIPVEIEVLEDKVTDIEEDIGLTDTEHTYLIVATVDLKGTTAKGKPVVGHYEQVLRMVVNEKTIELAGTIDGSNVEPCGDVTLTHSGRFGYDVYLEDNSLYDEDVLRSYGIPTAEPVAEPEIGAPGVTLGPGHVYFTRLIDSMEGSFDYRFECEAPVSAESHEVELRVALEAPDLWTREFSLVGPLSESGDCSVSFPMDLERYVELIEAIEEEIGAGADSHTIRYIAEVTTSVSSPAGAIEDTYTQTLEAKLEGNTLRFQEERALRRDGSLGGGVVPANPGSDGWGTPWLAGVAIGAVGLAAVAIVDRRMRLAPPSPDVEASRAEKKYRQSLVSVSTLPAGGPGAAVVRVTRLDELVRIAEDSGKPVLHYASEGRHSYLVLDGNVRYEYVIDGDLRTEDASSS